jgi:acetyltransferase-like isoleucine patch superfamily enzyme
MKSVVKAILQFAFTLLNIPHFVIYFSLALFVDKDSLIRSFSQWLSLFPGKLGVYLRAAFYHVTLSHCDKDVVVGFGTLFSQQDTHVYAGAYIGPQSNIGKCRIEKNCLLGSGVHIMSGKGQHNFTDIDTPVKEQGGVFTQVSIGEDSWVGNGALIMANIGKKCVVAAGSVVTQDVPDYAIVAGNPAKIVKSRVQTN